MEYLKIIRPVNFLFVGVCIAFGALYPDFLFKVQIFYLIAALASGMLIAAAGYVINDYYDLEIDRINKPERVLPSGKMSHNTALLYSIILFFLGIVLSYFTGRVLCISLAFVNSILLYMYARYFKKEFLVGNFLVAYAAASSFVFGGLAGKNLPHSLIIAFFAFFFTFWREIVKDLEDVKGDRETGARTLAICWSKHQVMLLCLLPLLAITGFNVYLFLTDVLSQPQFVLMIFFVILPVLLFYLILQRRNELKVYSSISSLMKLDMLIIILIFSIGKLI